MGNGWKRTTEMEWKVLCFRCFWRLFVCSSALLLQFTVLTAAKSPFLPFLSSAVPSDILVMVLCMQAGE